MTRQFYVFGQFMVYVKGGRGLFTEYEELGLVSESVIVRPRYQFKEMFVDDFGPSVPVDVQPLMMDCQVQMTLVHFDVDVLKKCMRATTGGAGDGTTAAAGKPIGGGSSILSTRNGYITLYLHPSVQAESSWRFFNAYLENNPMEYPLGTETSYVKLNWRAIPYTIATGTGEVTSPNIVLFDHPFDDLN